MDDRIITHFDDAKVSARGAASLRTAVEAPDEAEQTRQVNEQLKRPEPPLSINIRVIRNPDYVWSAR